MKLFAEEVRKAIKKLEEIDYSPRMIVIPEQLAFDICKRLTDVEDQITDIIKEIIDKVDDMIGGKMIAQALREIYLEEDL
jgi:hypothetical protein